MPLILEQQAMGKSCGAGPVGRARRFARRAQNNALQRFDNAAASTTAYDGGQSTYFDYRYSGQYHRYSL